MPFLPVADLIVDEPRDEINKNSAVGRFKKEESLLFTEFISSNKGTTLPAPVIRNLPDSSQTTIPVACQTI